MNSIFLVHDYILHQETLCKGGGGGGLGGRATFMTIKIQATFKHFSLCQSQILGTGLSVVVKESHTIRVVLKSQGTPHCAGGVCCYHAAW